MVNHYTAAKKIRHNDAYTPGGKSGKRPNRAVIAYTAAIKGAFKGLPTVIGGIEASLRRLAHYDYWSDKVRRSILIDSKADLLIFGMAERAILEIAQQLNRGEVLDTMTGIKGTGFVTKTSMNTREDWITLPSFEQLSGSPDAYNQAFKLASEQENPFSAKILIQPHGNHNLIVNPPALPLSAEELDQIYDLPFVRQPIRATARKFQLLSRFVILSPVIGAVSADVPFVLSLTIKAKPFNHAQKNLFYEKLAN